jgi:ankyrin repeat protein
VLDLKIRILTSAVLAAAALGVGLWTLAEKERMRPAAPLRQAAAGSQGELRGGPAVHPVDGEDAHGFTALDWAARSGRTGAIRELIQAGADPDGRDHGPNGWTPLEHAVHKGQLASVRALIAAGADAGAPGSSGITPLMLAAAQGEPEIVDALLAAGADPRAKQEAGQTALTYAVTTGDERVIRALLRRAPDLRLESSWRGRVARLLAAMRGQSGLLEGSGRAQEAMSRGVPR